MFVSVHSIKPKMDSIEASLYANLAKLVKWADFDSGKEKVDRKTVHSWMKDFETGLAVSGNES